MVVNDLRILVVAEREMTRRRIIECLREAGYDSIHQAESGSSALPLLHNGRYDLLLTDLDLPGRQSIDLLRMVRAEDKTSQLPVLLIGGKEQIAQFGMVPDSRACGVLQKPLTASGLRGKIEQVFSRLQAA